MQRAIKIVAALTLAGAVAGCASDAPPTTAKTTSISQGQELTDLQRALETGAINQREYDKLKGVILKRSQ
jgi:hypothetical protein